MTPFPTLAAAAAAHSPVPMLAVDPTGESPPANPAVDRVSGGRQEARLGGPVETRAPPGDRPRPAADPGPPHRLTDVAVVRAREAALLRDDQRATLDEQGTRRVRYIQQNAEHSQRRVPHPLELSRAGAALEDPVPVPLDRVPQTALADLATAAEERGTTVAGDPLPVVSR